MPLYKGGICFIAGPNPRLTITEQAEFALKAGIKWVQMRDKYSARRNIYLKALQIREIADKCHARLTINDYADIALLVQADGVHLGQEDLPLSDAKKIMNGKMIGISTHSIEQARAAQEGGADYIGFGPIFETATKDAGEPKGIKALESIRKEINIPIVAIGGIQAENARDLFNAGASAIAVSGAITRGDFASNAKKFLEELGRIASLN